MPPNEPAPVWGLVLAGGRSRRLGLDKAALEIHGAPQVCFCADILTRMLDAVYVSIRPGQREEPVFRGLPVIEDTRPDVGPMAGLLAAMERFPGVAWLVLACDLPLVTRDAVQALLDGRDPARGATAFMATDGFFEPLFAIYEPRIRDDLEARMRDGRYSLRQALTDHDVRLLCAPDDRVLMNINTPADLEEAQALIESVRRSQA